VILAGMVYEFASVYDAIATFWVPSGFAIVALYRLGVNKWPAVFIASCITGQMMGAPTLPGLGIAVGNTFETYFITSLLQSYTKEETLFYSLRGVLRFCIIVVVSVAVGTTISAVSAVYMTVGQTVPVTEFILTYELWFLGNVSGIFLNLPFLFITTEQKKYRFSPLQKIEISLFFLIILLLTVIIFELNHSYRFALAIFLIWTAFRFPPLVSVSMVFMVSVFSILFTISGVGPFAEGNQLAEVISLQLFLIMIQVTVLVISAALYEKNTAQRDLLKARDNLDNLVQKRTKRLMQANTELTEAHRQTKTVLESTTDGYFTLDTDFRFRYVNPQAENLLRKPREELIGKSMQKVFPEMKHSKAFQMYRYVQSSKESVHYEDYYAPFDQWFEVHIYPMPEGFAVYFRDITERIRSRQQLQESEELYRTLFETMTQGVLYRDGKGIIISANSAAERILGVSSKEILGKRHIPHAKPTYREDGVVFRDDEHPSSEALRTGRIVQNVIMRIYNDQEEKYKWIGVTAVPQFRPGENEPYQVYTTLTDITESKENQDALEENEQILRSIMNNMNSFLALLTPDGILIAVNDLPLEMAYLKEGDVLWKPFEECYWWSYSEESKKELRTAIQRVRKGEMLRYDTLNRLSDDTYITVDFYLAPVYGSDANIKYLVASGIDVTARKQAEEAVRRSEENFRNLAETIPQIVWTADIEGNTNYVNKRWAEYTGQAIVDLLPNGWVHAIHPEDRQYAAKEWNRAIREKNQFHVEYRILNHKTNAYKWFLGRALPIRNTEGTITQWFGTATDIDDQKRTIRAQTFLSEATKILASTDEVHDLLVQIAKRAAKGIGDWCGIQMLEDDGTLYDIAFVHHDKKKMEWAQHLRSTLNHNVMHNSLLVEVLQTQQTVIHEVTSHTYLEGIITDSQYYDFWKQLDARSFLITPIIIDKKIKGFITLISAEGKVQYGSITQHMLEELAGRVSLAMQNATLYKELQKQEAQFQALRDANIIGVVYAKQDGSIIDANKAFTDMIGYTTKQFRGKSKTWTDITPLEFQSTELLKKKELEQSGVAKPWEQELIRKDGTRTPVIVGRVSLDYNSEHIAFVLDITERKELEKRKDEFLGIASHELKTPLSSIKGYTQILERIIHQLGDEKLKTYLRKTNTYIDRLNSLIADLLDVSKIQAGKLQFNYGTFSFFELLVDSIESIRHTYPSQSIVIEQTVDETITGDRHRLEQVFTNLLTNAIKYSKKGQEVVVSAKKVDDMIQVSVQDFGVGISKKEQAKIFERFYRVKSIEKQYSGLGIGLYVSFEIIQRHGGQMWVESVVGKGSTFYFRVPITSADRA
jgi:PAS domain S-box-containing protein